jgi:hypothetical protein
VVAETALIVTVVPGPMETVAVLKSNVNVTVAPVASSVAPVAARGVCTVAVSMLN